jgi:Silencing defective 2 N-terminal ubiquitin domain
MHFYYFTLDTVLLFCWERPFPLSVETTLDRIPYLNKLTQYKAFVRLASRVGKSSWHISSEALFGTITHPLQLLRAPLIPIQFESIGLIGSSAMTTGFVNVFITPFSGLGLPPTVSFPIESSSSVCDLVAIASARIPRTITRLVLTTTSNKQLSPSSTVPISDLLSHADDEIIPLRLSVSLCGGKGGFGSQLRAAGGRMSSRRKKNQSENNGSNRNLDGRRLRTVTEAKKLAEYLAVKPDMEKKEKEAKRKRWEQIVELAEQRQEELKSGAKAKLDGKWLEEKEAAITRLREAALKSMENYQPKFFAPSTSESSISKASSSSSSQGQKEAPILKFSGFEEDDEFMSDSDDDDEEDGKDENEDRTVDGDVKGKGKAKA